MPTYFPDTNLFFECQKIANLPWHELQNRKPEEAEPVRLIIPSQVVIEIEKHKAKGNSRTAKRARDASANMRQALLSSSHSMVMKGDNPKVELHLPSVVKVDFSKFPSLMEDRGDHRILAEFAELRKTENGLILLTDDTLLVIAARSLGFVPILVPEHWKLGTEKDERDDEIDRLRSELKTYKQNSPILALSFLNYEDEETDTVEFSVERHEIAEDEVHKFMDFIKTRSPLCTDFPTKAPHSSAYGLAGFGGRWMPPRDTEIARYTDEKYPDWLRNIERKVRSLPDELDSIANEVSFNLKINNSGYINGNDVQLFLQGYDGILLLDELDEDDEAQRRKSQQFPKAPVPPKGGYISVADAFAVRPISSMPDLRFPSPGRRDPNAFYYSGGRPDEPVDHLRLTCEALPHQTRDFILGFRAVVAQRALGSKPRLRIRIEASNLRQPIEKYIKFTVNYKDGQFINKLFRIYGDE